MSATWDIVVIGAGAAGLLAAARAAERHHRVLLLEKNSKPGVKILMSGGTRCNVTHAVDSRGIVEAFGPQGPFLYSALAALAPDDVVTLFEAEGVRTKVEAGGKVFPASNKANDVLDALRRRLQRSGALLSLQEPVLDLSHRTDGDGFSIATPRRQLLAAKVILTAGGQSYPGCGTRGDGYRWAQRLGHTIVPPRPALVPLKIRADWAKSLRGVTVPDVTVRITLGESASTPNPPVEGSPREKRGSFLFTHFGLSGPAVLDVSRAVSQHPRPRSLELQCDFLPGTQVAQLEAHWRQEAATHGKKHVAATLTESLPRRLADALLVEAGVPLDRTCAELSRDERTRLAAALKSTRFPLTGTLGFEKAEVTAGGIALDEVDSSTMASKLVAGLYIAGEVLDLDGPIGGYNFQAAFSTGWLAAQSV